LYETNFPGTCFLCLLFNKGVTCTTTNEHKFAFECKAAQYRYHFSVHSKGRFITIAKALTDGLDAGLTVNEIKEVLVQLYAYTGFPRSLNALQTFADVLNQRKQNGIKDELGKEASPLQPIKANFNLERRCKRSLWGNQ
jgi:hypothetical protein